MLLIFLAAQAAAAAAPPPADQAAPQRFSILVPVRPQPCRSKAPDVDVTVCANGLPDQRLPYPELIPPDHPVPSNPERTGTRALAVTAEPTCTGLQPCTVGFGPPIVPIIKWVADRVTDATRRKLDKRGRVAIPLEDPPANARGKVSD